MLDSQTINFRKSEMVNNTVMKMKGYQVEYYKFDIIEPVFTLLQELPALMDDNDLWDLSVMLEPKKKSEKN